MNGYGDMRFGVYIKTFGCLMNQYDSERMISALSSDYQHVNEIEQARLIILNSCSVRAKGEHKLYSLLGVLKELKRNKPELMIGVVGCVAQQEGQKILRRAPCVDFVIGTHNISLIPAVVSQIRDGHSGIVAVDYREEWEELPLGFEELSEGVSGSLAARALVAIQRGCSKGCAFCVVPHTRGPEVSRSRAEILREVRLNLRRGAKEIILLGQTVNSWGKDLSPRSSFEDLVKEIAQLEGVCRIRFTSPHPQEVRPGFIELYRHVPQLCPHIHLPLQSGSDRVLAAMNRNYRMRRFLEIIEALRAARSDIALSTDLIVGFPTEKESDFQLTLEAVRSIRFDWSYAFVYSPRPNTSANQAYSTADCLPEGTARRRLLELQAVQEGISLEIHEKMIGVEVEVLVEGRSTNISSLMRGRTPHNTHVEVEALAAPAIGDLLAVAIEHAGAYGLRGRAIVNASWS